jgi:hypothetical protein
VKVTQIIRPWGTQMYLLCPPKTFAMFLASCSAYQQLQHVWIGRKSYRTSCNNRKDLCKASREDRLDK